MELAWSFLQFTNTTVDNHSSIYFFFHVIYYWFHSTDIKSQRESSCVNSKLFKICQLFLLSITTCSIVSTKFAVIVHYIASAGFTVAFYPSDNLSFWHYFSHLSSYLSAQDVSFPVFVAIYFFFFVFSTFNGPSDETLLVKITWNHLCRAGSFVIIILLYQPLEYKQFSFCR